MKVIKSPLFIYTFNLFNLILIIDSEVLDRNYLPLAKKLRLFLSFNLILTMSSSDWINYKYQVIILNSYTFSIPGNLLRDSTVFNSSCGFRNSPFSNHLNLLTLKDSSQTISRGYNLESVKYLYKFKLFIINKSKNNLHNTLTHYKLSIIN